VVVEQAILVHGGVGTGHTGLLGHGGIGEGHIATNILIIAILTRIIFSHGGYMNHVLDHDAFGTIF